jgi:hypothetical protein
MSIVYLLLNANPYRTLLLKKDTAPDRADPELMTSASKVLSASETVPGAMSGIDTGNVVKFSVPGSGVIACVPVAEAVGVNVVMDKDAASGVATMPDPIDGAWAVRVSAAGSGTLTRFAVAVTVGANVVVVSWASPGTTA